jgi:hypothetical protein
MLTISTRRCDMANNSLANIEESKKLKDNELIYLSSIICDLLTDLEPRIAKTFKNDQSAKLLLNVKKMWVQRFKQI